MAETKKKRRQYKSGSITKRSDGRWQASFEDGYNEKGNRHRVYVYGKTKAEVETKLLARQRERNSADAPSADVSVRTTVKAWSEEWLQLRERKVRPKTYETDATAVRRWIVPTIGHRRLSDLTPADVRKVHAAQRGKVNTSTMNRYHQSLTAMLRAAIVEGHGIPRRVLDVDIPTRAVNDRTNVSLVHSLAMLQVASYLPHGSRWAMTFLHGWRQAECLGLTWDCVNLNTGLVTAEWQLQSIPYIDYRQKHLGFRLPDGYEVRHLEGQYHLTRPKTKKGYRVAPLLPAMREALEHWREICPDSPHGLVWPAADGSPANARQDREEWEAIQGSAQVGHEAGRYYKVHEGRHATATELLESGASDVETELLMGHSSIRTTRGYQHPSQLASLTALEKLGERFNINIFAPQEPGLTAPADGS